MSVYESIVRGLNEAIEYARGDKSKGRVLPPLENTTAEKDSDNMDEDSEN